MVRRNLRKPANDNEPVVAVVYTRLSRAKTGETKGQAERNTEASLETQRAGCERAIAAMGGTVIASEHDVAAGDRIDNRTGLFRAVERIESGDANTLIVYSLERLSRDALQQSAVVQALRRAGGRILSATENVEEGPLGDLMRAVYAFGGAYELAKTRERVQRSQDAKFRQKGRYKPARRPPYGYRRIGSGEDATYEIDPAEAQIVTRIFAERAAGSSIRQIILRLRADKVPTPSGRGQWGTTSVQGVLDRSVYVTGNHEVWRTKTVRDADGVPYLEPRPVEERYYVPFPSFIDPTIAELATNVAGRNVWTSHRWDRNPEIGIGRYGFFRCGGCGRAMAVRKPKGVGLVKYACTTREHLSRPCPAATSISVHKLDQPVWWWIQSVIEHPERADAWIPAEVPPQVDAMTIQALREAEETVSKLETRAAGMLENLSLLTGAVARTAAAKLNDLNAELEAAIARRDALAATAAKADGPPVKMLFAADALAEATHLALEAMKAADPNPERTHTITFDTPVGPRSHVVPDSWKAKRAAMTALNVSVYVNQEASDQPRWVAEMRPPGGVIIRGADDGRGWFTDFGDYLFRTHQCSKLWQEDRRR